MVTPRASSVSTIRDYGWLGASQPTTQHRIIPPPKTPSLDFELPYPILGMGNAAPTRKRGHGPWMSRRQTCSTVACLARRSRSLI